MAELTVRVGSREAGTEAERAITADLALRNGPMGTDSQLHRLLALSKEHYQRLNHGSILHEHVCTECGRTVTCCCKDRRRVDRLSMRARRIRCVECLEMGEMGEEASDVT